MTHDRPGPSWHREPLLHFLVLGGLLFAFHAWRSGAAPAPAEDGTPTIEVDAALVNLLCGRWEKQWQRAPTGAELRRAVEEHVREEVLYREALAMGLDRDDSVIRRRLAQKMEFLTTDVAGLDAPGEDALRAYLDEHIDAYTGPARVSFEHVYFSRARRGEGARAAAAGALASLAADPQAAPGPGDAFLLRSEFQDAPLDEIGGLLGRAFADAVGALPVGSWQGPVESAYGAHLVRITARAEAPAPALDDVRDAVVRDFQQDRREELNAKLFEGVRARYRVRVDEAAIGAAAARAAAGGTSP